MHNIPFNHREIEYKSKCYWEEKQIQPVFLNAPMTGFAPKEAYLSEYALDYGLESLFLYELFVGFQNGAADEESYLETELDGVYNFLKKVNRIAVEYGKHMRKADEVENDRKEVDNQFLKQMILALNTPLEKKHERAYVALLMEYSGKIRDLSEEGLCTDEIWKHYLIFLGLLAPANAQNAWNLSCYDEELFAQNWPYPDPEFVQTGEVTIPVQIREKTKAELVLKRNTSPEEAKRMARELLLKEKILTEADWEKARVIYVPGKIMNIIIPE